MSDLDFLLFVVITVILLEWLKRRRRWRRNDLSSR